jgi:hypothetical protein
VQEGNKPVAHSVGSGRRGEPALSAFARAGDVYTQNGPLYTLIAEDNLERSRHPARLFSPVAELFE